jgi:hypothetical protein
VLPNMETFIKMAQLFDRKIALLPPQVVENVRQIIALEPDVTAVSLSKGIKVTELST